MKHIAQEDFAERVPVNQQGYDSTFRPSYGPQVGFSKEKGFNHSDGRLGKANKTEIVGWISVVLLAFLTATAFYLLWLKAGGTEDLVRYRADALPLRKQELRSM